MRSAQGLIWALVLGGAVWAKPLTKLSGQVAQVVDGDTIRVRFSDGEKAVRLGNIDAPELSQDGGEASRQALSRAIPVGSHIRVMSTGQDRYHRIIGEIYRPDGADINVLQVRNGHAWVYLKYCRDLPSWQPMEAKARAEHRGLWAGKNPIPPWEFRHGRLPPPGQPQGRPR